MSGAHYWLTSDRLALRRFTADDIDWLANLYSDPDVTRYLGGIKDRTTSEELLRTRILQYYDEHPGLGIWMTVERATGTCVGFHLLNHIRGESIIQTGFALVKSAWGKGFATEMAAAVLRYGFVDLQLPRIAGMASLHNYASQRGAAENRAGAARRARLSASGLCLGRPNGLVPARCGRLAG